MKDIGFYPCRYAGYVIEKLVGIKGVNTSDVASFIINQWISEHRDELKDLGINVKRSAVRGAREA